MSETPWGWKPHMLCRCSVPSSCGFQHFSDTRVTKEHPSQIPSSAERALRDSLCPAGLHGAVVSHHQSKSHFPFCGQEQELFGFTQTPPGFCQSPISQCSTALPPPPLPQPNPPEMPSDPLKDQFSLSDSCLISKDCYCFQSSNLIYLQRPFSVPGKEKIPWEF